ncbi:MAG: helix-turn-helix transcriptional regulator [Cohaesibacteraceae bacterium]|nr:helix-turn-helix transcriptional regulator [Cohaesibacteraceae bacterium]
MSTIHPVDRHVGLKLREARISQGLSQTALAEKIGISFQQVQKYESGANRISASRLYDVSRVLKADIRYFFDEIVADEDGNGVSSPYTNKNIGVEDLKIVDLLSRVEDRGIKQQIYQLLKTLAEWDANHRPA